MPRKPTTSLAALLVAAAVAACGSSSSGNGKHAASTTTVPTTSSVSARPAATVHGMSVHFKLAGTSGAKLTVADVKRLKVQRRKSEHAHLAGLGNLSLTQKLKVFLDTMNHFWQTAFQTANGQLPTGNAVVIADQPFACGSIQWTTSSAPSYCPPNDTMMFPLGAITSNVEPLGDAATLLMTADLYGYHIENALGALSRGYSGPQIKEMDSCLSGVFFAAVAGDLQPKDEQSVNGYLAQESQASGTAAGAGGVTAEDLATSFNKGYTSFRAGVPHPEVCVPS